MRSRVTTRQIGGDDGFQWCVLIDGRVVMSGMSRREAQYEKRKQEEKLNSKEQK